MDDNIETRMKMRRTVTQLLYELNFAQLCSVLNHIIDLMS